MNELKKNEETVDHRIQLFVETHSSLKKLSLCIGKKYTRLHRTGSAESLQNWNRRNLLLLIKKEKTKRKRKILSEGILNLFQSSPFSFRDPKCNKYHSKGTQYHINGEGSCQ